MEAFADFLITEVFGGTLPDGIEEGAFRTGVALGGSTRGYFQASDAWKADPRNYLANVDANRAAKAEERAAKARAAALAPEVAEGDSEPAPAGSEPASGNVEPGAPKPSAPKRRGPAGVDPTTKAVIDALPKRGENAA